MKIYGIPNCDTVKKALNWFKANDMNFEFHDFKKRGINESKLREWSETLGWEALINKKGTTWRKLDAATQAEITNEESAFRILQEQPSMIKRPVIETANGLLTGFDESKYEEYFKK